MRYGSVLLVFVLLGACADTSPEEVERRRAREIAQTALAALESGDAATAATGFEEAADLAPNEPVLHYDHGVALRESGERDDALTAFGEALRAADPADPVASDALFNVGTENLQSAWLAAGVVAPEALRAALPERLRVGVDLPAGPPAEAISPEVKQQAAQNGLAAATEAVHALRDLVRRTPGDTDAVQNLVLAQAVRRALETTLEEMERESSPDDQQGDQQGEQGQEQEGGQSGEDGQSSDEQQPQPDGAEGSEKPEPEGQGQAAGETPEEDEQARQDEASASRGEEGEGDEQEQQEAAATDPTEDPQERAERALERLLESAAQRARVVREQRAARARRAKVERDW